MICAIDPGNAESAYVLLDSGTLKPVSVGKVDNKTLLDKIWKLPYDTELVIEMVASYGMAVGREVFDTVFWIGRFWEAGNGLRRELVYRREEKLDLCGSCKAKDANIRQALIDRFAPGVRNDGKGTQKEPGWFYGFAADIWQAYAVGVTFADKKQGKTRP